MLNFEDKSETLRRLNSDTEHEDIIKETWLLIQGLFPTTLAKTVSYTGKPS